MKLTFKTKAENLRDLRDALKSAKILPLTFFSVQKWQNDNFAVLEGLNTSFPDQPLIVRSSGKAEDSATQSLAGHFASFLNVESANLSSAIEKVISSFGSNTQADDQVLVQPMLEDVENSGVVFTKNMSNGSHYFIVNFDMSYRVPFICLFYYFVIYHVCKWSKALC